ncbi:uncharacterized protein N7483_010042 [Penicillium malachiteum]|uniref:uncharacterized protein n=1 Tax=Penicillium malachiteum TaxID=1324776 RepID=UPI002547221B|nr:uncharacterized protein N7483_010042 [Penicillium malachiteum]KAJ5712861.1 hypothetical protein N7483_010042 [Penicillium malachiteum]
MSDQGRENLRGTTANGANTNGATTNGDSTNARVTDKELLAFTSSDRSVAFVDNWLVDGHFEGAGPTGTSNGYHGESGDNEADNDQYPDSEDEYPDLWTMFELELDDPADNQPATANSHAATGQPSTPASGTGASGTNAGSGSPTAASAVTGDRNEATNPAASGVRRLQRRHSR